MGTFINDGNPNDGLQGITADPHHNGVFGRNNSTTGRNTNDPGGNGVFGFTQVPDGAGVLGAHNTGGVGVSGIGTDERSPVFPHIRKHDAVGVRGTSDSGDGVQGISGSANNSGVFGRNDGPGGVGVKGFSDTGSGMLAQSNQGSGIVATSDGGQGVSAFSKNDVGIFAQGATWAGVFNGRLVVSQSPTPKDPPGNLPPPPDGSIVITDGSLFVNKGDVILGNGDCAEDFGISASARVEPGTVVVLDDDGELCESTTPYDTRVAGVISGAGTYKPGLVLDRHLGEPGRAPVALVGKVYCKADAEYGSIRVGDLLTTSPTTGHAMKATDGIRAFGAVIGKALQPLQTGKGMLRILVALQ